VFNLGDLEFTLGINTRELDAAYQRIATFGEKVMQVQNRANRGAETAIGAYRKNENALLSSGEKLNTLLHRIESAKIAPDIKTNLIRDAERAYSDLTQRATEYKKVTDNTNINRATAQFQNQLGDVGRSLAFIVAEEREAAAAASRLATEQARAAQQSERLAAAVERAAISQARTLSGGLERGRNLAGTIETSGLGTNPRAIQLTDRLNEAMQRLKGVLSGPEPLKPREFMQATTQYNSALGSIRREFQALKAQSADKGPLSPEAWRVLKEKMQAAGATMLLINGHLGGMSTRFFALGSLLRETSVGFAVVTAGLVGAGIAIVAIGQKSLEAAMKIERIEKALAAVTPNAAVAASEFNTLKDIASQSGVVFTELASSYGRYLAASTAAGQTYEETSNQFRSVALAAGTLSLTVEDTQGVFRAFEQILSKGKVQAEELRGQLGDRLPGAFNIAAKAMGVTTSELNKLMKDGEVLSRDFVPKFVKALEVAYNIQADKPIDTLQAAINRATNAVDLFFTAFARNTQILEAAKAALSIFARALTFLERNLDQIIKAVLQTTGAIAGFAAGWFALATALAAGRAIIVVTTAIGVFGRTLFIATTATNGLRTAVLALNAAMLATAAGKFVNILLRLAVAIGGAVLGMRLMENMLDQTNESFDAGLAHIQQYIDSQMELGFQVRKVTDDLRKQAAVLANTAHLRAQDAEAALRSAQASGPGVMDTVRAIGAGWTGRISGPTAEYQNRIEKLKREAAQANKDAMRAVSVLAGIENVGNTLPDMSSALSAGLGGDGKKDGGKDAKAKAEENIDAVMRLISAYDLLQAKIEVLDQGPDAFERLDNVQAARDAIEGFTSNQLAKADAALRAVGLTTGTVEDRLAGLVEDTKKAEKGLEAFTNVLNQIKDLQVEISNGQSLVDNLLSGGDAASDSKLRNFQEAMKAIKDLSPEAIQVLTARLLEMGAAIVVSSDPTKALAEALADLMNQAEQINQTRDAIKDFQNELREVEEQTNSDRYRVAGIQSGRRGRELDRWVEEQEVIGEWTKTLTAAGLSAEQVSAEIAKMHAVLGDAAAQDKILENAERWAEFTDDAAQAIADFAGAAVKNFKNIGEAIDSLIDRLVDMAIEFLVVQPIFEAMRNLLGQISGGSGGGGGILGLFGFGGGFGGNTPQGGSSGLVRSFSGGGGGGFGSASNQFAQSFGGGGPGLLRVAIDVTTNDNFDAKVSTTADKRIQASAPDIIRGSLQAVQQVYGRRTITGG
jgi:tape measure domain-containing protein